jgi:hypothetical protein
VDLDWLVGINAIAMLAVSFVNFSALVPHSAAERLARALPAAVDVVVAVGLLLAAVCSQPAFEEHA